MTNLEGYLYKKVKPIIESWNESGVYAISFFVYSNGAYMYQGNSNVCEFAISYNTEDDVKRNMSSYASANEVRWNYAFWRQSTTHIIDPQEADDEGIETLFKWYGENGIDDIGVYSNENQYDETGMYIGKGPGGYFELLTAVSNVAQRLQHEDFIRVKFGRIPIIVHGLEYDHLVKFATQNANPNNEAADFLNAAESLFE